MWFTTLAQNGCTNDRGHGPLSPSALCVLWLPNFQVQAKHHGYSSNRFLGHTLFGKETRNCKLALIMPKRKSAPVEEPAVESGRRRSGRLQKSEDAAPFKPGVNGGEPKPSGKRSAPGRKPEKVSTVYGAIWSYTFLPASASPPSRVHQLGPFPSTCSSPRSCTHRPGNARLQGLIQPQEQPAAKPEPPAKKGRLGKQPAATKKTGAAEKTATSGGNEPQQAPSKVADAATDGSTSTDVEKNYWLLKAEPETRLENGVDVRFSIDDLAAKTEPEPWDGRLPC